MIPTMFYFLTFVKAMILICLEHHIYAIIFFNLFLRNEYYEAVAMTGISSKTLFYFAAVVIWVSNLGGVGAEMKTGTVNLPKTIGIWTRSDSVQIIDSSNIFDYMDGAGELYLAYGFDHLEAYQYTADQQDSILVEVYVMDTSDDAFGLLSLDWGGEPVTLHPIRSVPSNTTVAPPFRALYGAGLLRIWADTIYARVMAYRETEASKDAVISLGRTIAANRKIQDEPELLKRLPRAIGPDWKLRDDRVGYFRSHLVLNSLYYLSHQNILDLDHSTEAVAAVYEKTSNAGVPHVQVLLVKYPSPARAGKALNDFHSEYLHEYQRGFDPGVTAKHTNFFSIEDGWLGYSLDGIYLAIVFECSNRETAQLFLKHLSISAENKEIKHER